MSTWLRFSSSSAASNGASVLACSARLVSCTPSGASSAIRPANSSARSSSRSACDEFADQTAAVGLLGRDGAAGEHPVGGDAGADDAGQVVAHAHLGTGQPEQDRGVAE